VSHPRSPTRAAPHGAAAKTAAKAAAGASATAPAGSVRIIGGTWRRSRLPVPRSPGLRPTPDRVRETLFNWLGQDLPGWRVLDAFAGSGALGFEAASRGAAEAVLLERDPALVRALRASRERLQATQVRIEQADALRWMEGAPPAGFHLVMLDPPFDAGLHLPALRAATHLLVPPGFIYVEAGRPFTQDELAPLGLQVHRAGHAGNVCFHLLRSAGTAPGA
jgi:16S rRNA (guanine966-N2)-methyltransferase